MNVAIRVKSLKILLIQELKLSILVVKVSWIEIYSNMHPAKRKAK